MNIPFFNFGPAHSAIKGEMQKTFEQVYDSYWYIMGDRLFDFEKEYAKFSNTNYAVGVSNGLDALHLALKVLGVGKGDEVIVPSNTYIATVLAVSYVGATPVFVEPDYRTYNIAPANIESAVTSKTKAIMPVHLYGQPCEMEEIMRIADKYGLFVVEDNAQSHAATFKGKITGSWGHANGTSFYPSKNLGALGDAGAVTTNDESIAKKVKILRNYGSQVKYLNETVGFNMRLDELHAAFLILKLNYILGLTIDRQQIAGWYNEELQGIPDLVLPYVHPDATHSYHLYVVRTNERNALQQKLTDNSIGTLIHYPIPPHLQEAYKNLGYSKGAFPIAEELANTCLSLPLWPGMDRATVQQVSSVVRNFFNQ